MALAGVVLAEVHVVLVLGMCLLCVGVLRARGWGWRFALGYGVGGGFAVCVLGALVLALWESFSILS